MGQSLKDIAQKLRDTNKKVQLIYAFNGVGKTRLSREFKNLVEPKLEDVEGESIKILYYNAFTEDLFYWDNDERKMKIQSNGFTDLVIKDQGQETNITKQFQRYTSDKLTPTFNEDYSEVAFSIKTGDDKSINDIKISKGEESCFIWCVFYSLLQLVIETLNEPELANRDNNQFDNLEYVFIDDPVSSLDENHLIELAVNIAELVESSLSDVKFIITTHNPLFYNVLYNELNNADERTKDKAKKSLKKRLEKLDDGTFLLHDSNDSPFSYHLFLLSELEKVIQSGEIKKYHYNFLRQILEKTSTFLGYKKWRELLTLLPNDSHEAYYNRIINLCSHGKHSGEETSLIDNNDKRVLGYLVRELKNIYHFK